MQPQYSYIPGPQPVGPVHPSYATMTGPAAADAKSTYSRRSRQSRHSRRSRSGERRRSRSKDRRTSAASEHTTQTRRSDATRTTEKPGKFGTKRVGPEGQAAHVKFVLDGETRQVEGRQLKVKRLGARALSHEEERPDFVHLDYTPINVHLPIDLLYPVRMRRRMNQIEGLQLALLVGIHLNGNEEPRDVAHTLSALANSLQMLKQRTDIEWDECGVVLLVDGRSTLSEELKHFLAHEIRIYDESLLELTYDGSDTTVHLFERSVELPKHQTQRSYHDPLQMSLAVKELKGAGKLTSHLWFFTAFCTQIQPTYCLLLDAGVRPKPGAVSRMVLALDRDPHLAGVAGDIGVLGLEWYNPWHAMSAFQTSFASVLDRPLEALSGFLPSTPSRFVLYQWTAIRGQPLAMYLRPEEEDVEITPFQANKYLTPDRVLNLEMATKKTRAWRMGYESLAQADAPFPRTLPDLLELKRCELNGALFNDLQFLTRCPAKLCCESRHGVCMRCCLTCMWFERLMLMIFRWLFAGSLFLAFNILATTVLERISQIGLGLAFAFLIAYTSLLALQIIAGLGANAARVGLMYWLSNLAFALMTFFALAMAAYLISIEGQAFFSSTIIFWTCIGVVGAIALASVVHCKCHTIILTGIPSILLIPTFVTVFPIYAITHLNDATWNVREDRLAALNVRPEDEKRNRAARMQERANREMAELQGGADVYEDEEMLLSFGGARPSSAEGFPPDRTSVSHAVGTSSPTAVEARAAGMEGGSPVTQVGGAHIEVDHEVASTDGGSASAASEAMDQVPPLKSDAQRKGRGTRRSMESSGGSSEIVEEVVEIPNDVAFVINACRNTSTFEAHKAVIDALRAEGERVRQVGRLAAAKQEDQAAEFSAFRTRVLGIYLICNFMWIAIITYFQFRTAFIYGTAALFGFLMAVRLISSLLYACGQFLTRSISCFSVLCCCCSCCHGIARCCAPCCICCLWCIRPMVESDAKGVQDIETGHAGAGGAPSGRSKRSSAEADLHLPDDGYDDEMPPEGDVAEVGASTAVARPLPSASRGGVTDIRSRKRKRASVIRLDNQPSMTATTMQEGLAANRAAMASALGGSPSAVSPDGSPVPLGGMSQDELRRALRNRDLRRSESGTDLNWLAPFKAPGRASGVGAAGPLASPASRPPATVAGGRAVPALVEGTGLELDEGDEDEDDDDYGADADVEDDDDAKAGPVGISTRDPETGQWVQAALPGAASPSRHGLQDVGDDDDTSSAASPHPRRSSAHR